MNIRKFYKYKNWYRKTRSRLIKLYGKDYKLFAGLLASTSPRFQVKRNYSTSLLIYNDYLKGKETFLANAIENKKEFIKYYKLLPCHYNNIIRTLSHNYTSSKSLELSGNKVNAFFNNITGNYNLVTIDVHMLHYFKDYSKNGISLGKYKYYSRIIRKLSKKLSLFPAELQAVLWEKQRYNAGLKPSNFYQYMN